MSSGDSAANLPPPPAGQAHLDPNVEGLEKIKGTTLSLASMIELTSDEEMTPIGQPANPAPPKTPHKKAKRPATTQGPQPIKLRSTRLGKATTTEGQEEPDPNKNREESGTTHGTAPITYWDYVGSQQFKFDSPWVALTRCAQLSLNAEEDVQTFWREYHPIYTHWLKEQKAAQVKNLLDVAPDGILAQRYVMKGVDLGISLAKDDSHNMMLKNIGSLMETMTASSKLLYQESMAHKAQTIEFVSQINNASETVATLQNTMEQLKLENLKKQLSPMIQESIPGPSGLDRPTVSRSSSIPFLSKPSGQPVELVSIPGHYDSDKGHIKVGDKSLISIDLSSGTLKTLSPLLGGNLTAALIIINKDLDQMQIIAEKDPCWLDKVFSAPKEERNKLLIDALKPLKTRKYQWSRRDID